MEAKMKFSIMHLVLWMAVGILFLLIFFSYPNIEAWGDDKNKTILLAVLFVLGFGGDALLRFFFRRNPSKNEEDDIVRYKAATYSFIPVLVYVFMLSISLYIKYENAGAVPAGWLWFIAYSLIVAANVSASAFSIYFQRKL